MVMSTLATMKYIRSPIQSVESVALHSNKSDRGQLKGRGVKSHPSSVPFFAESLEDVAIQFDVKSDVNSSCIAALSDFALVSPVPRHQPAINRHQPPSNLERKNPTVLSLSPISLL